MEKVREVLRLHEEGLGKSSISLTLGISRQTVRDYISKAKILGISRISLDGISEDELRAKFGKKAPGRRTKDTSLDYEGLRRELSRKGVTMLLLWEEYQREHPDGYSYSHFCEKYNQWAKRQELPMRQTHKAGEKAGVDFSGQTVEIVGLHTGVVSHAQVFVGSLAYSNYIYAEALPSQELIHWLGAHRRMFEFFGGVPEIVVPDNLKSGVTSPCRYDPEINKSYQELAEHYGVAIVPARVRRPQDKAWVENAVQNVERRILAVLRNRIFRKRSSKDIPLQNPSNSFRTSILI